MIYILTHDVGFGLDEILEMEIWEMIVWIEKHNAIEERRAKAARSEIERETRG